MKKLIVLTGAGISAESGIQTFRDSNGLWENHRVEDVASPEGWRRNRQLVLDFYNARRAQAAQCQPNAGHFGLVDLEKDFDVTVITQNVDDLHERAGSTNVIHLHGQLDLMCSSMDKTKTMPYTEDIKIGDKHADGSQLRPFIVWFGESVPEYERAAKIAMWADVFVVIGTQLNVYPAAGLVNLPVYDCPKFIVDPKIPIDVASFRNLTAIEAPATEGIEILKQKLRDLKWD